MPDAPSSATACPSGRAPRRAGAMCPGKALAGRKRLAADWLKPELLMTRPESLRPLGVLNYPRVPCRSVSWRGEWQETRGAANRFNQAALPTFHQQIDRNDQRDAEKGHEQRTADKVGEANHGQASDEGHHLLLLFAVYEIPDADRSPNQGGEQKPGVKDVHQDGNDRPHFEPGHGGSIAPTSRRRNLPDASFACPNVGPAVTTRPGMWSLRGPGWAGHTTKQLALARELPSLN